MTTTPPKANGFVFASDTHLRQHIWTNRQDLVDDTAMAVTQIVDGCIERGCDLVLGGDNFDNPWPTSESIVLMQELVGRLTAEGLRCLALDGNHDMATPSWADVFGAIPINDKPFRVAGITGYGVAYRYKDQLEADVPGILKGTQNCEMLVMHQLLDTMCRKFGMWNMAAEWFNESPAKLILMGDYHVPCETVSPAGVKFLYNGSPCAMDLGEISDNPSRRMTHVRRAPDGKLATGSIPLLTRRFMGIEANSKQELEEALTPELLAQLTAARVNYGKYSLQPVLMVSTPPTIAGVRSMVTDFIKDAAYFWHQPSILDKEISTSALEAGGVALGRPALIRAQIDLLLDPVKASTANMLAQELSCCTDPAALATAYIKRELELAKNEAASAEELSQA